MAPPASWTGWRKPPGAAPTWRSCRKSRSTPGDLRPGPRFPMTPSRRAVSESSAIVRRRMARPARGGSWRCFIAPLRFRHPGQRSGRGPRVRLRYCAAQCCRMRRKSAAQLKRWCHVLLPPLRLHEASQSGARTFVSPHRAGTLQVPLTTWGADCLVLFVQIGVDRFFLTVLDRLLSDST